MLNYTQAKNLEILTILLNQKREKNNNVKKTYPKNAITR